MDEEIQEMLGEEIKSQIQELSNLKSGSKEKTEAINDLSKLYSLKIEETKIEMELTDKRNVDKNDAQIRKDQLSEQVKERYFRLGIAAAEIILPLIFYASWMRKGFRFEETGTYTSTTFRGLFNRFKPTKK